MRDGAVWTTVPAHADRQYKRELKNACSWSIKHTWSHLIVQAELMADIILTAFRTYCQPIHEFWAHPMADTVTFGKYVTGLRQKSKESKFGTSENDMLREIVFSLNDQWLKERLLRVKSHNWESDRPLQSSWDCQSKIAGNEYNTARKSNTCS